MQLRPAVNFKRWPKGRDALSQRKQQWKKWSLMTPTDDWGRSLFHKNLLQPQQATWLPHLLGLCSQNPPRVRLSLRSALPHIIAGHGDGQVWPQEASRSESPRACPLALAAARLWSRPLHFLPSKPSPRTCPATSNYPGSCLGRGGESIKLTDIQI